MLDFVLWTIWLFMGVAFLVWGAVLLVVISVFWQLFLRVIRK